MFVKINWRAVEYDRKQETLLDWCTREGLKKDAIFLVVDKHPYIHSEKIAMKSDKGRIYWVNSRYTERFTPTENLEDWL